MKIYTYHVDVPLIDQGLQQRVIEEWRKSWAKFGWEPEVLTEGHAQLNPRYIPFTQILSRTPFMNSYAYEIACFHRWLAVENAGGGFMSDYDCLNYNLEPMDIPKRMTICEPPHVPCLVGGTKEEYGRMAELFMKFSVGDYREDMKPHSKNGTAISDMLILANDQSQFDTMPLVKQFNEVGWEKARAIHFSHNSTRGMTKIAAIQQWKDLCA